MQFDNADIAGLIAATLTTISFLPQAIKTIKTKDTSGISFLMYLIFCIGVIFWAIFGLIIEKYIIVTANLITFSFAFSILLIKIKNIISGADK